MVRDDLAAGGLVEVLHSWSFHAAGRAPAGPRDGALLDYLGEALAAAPWAREITS